MPSVTPDPKPEPRMKDSAALARARLVWDECASCRRPPANAHHVIPKSEGGDDVEANIVMVCGSGSWRCHGALHGAPYDDGTRRWSTMETYEAVGRFILARRPDTVEYVLTKLGWAAGREYLERRYYLHLPADYATPA